MVLSGEGILQQKYQQMQELRWFQDLYVYRKHTWNAHQEVSLWSPVDLYALDDYRYLFQAGKRC